MPFLIVSFLISIHEIGHFLTAKYFGFDIDKIYFYPYGGISKFHLKMNVSLNKELIILIMGPLFQFLAYFILMNFNFLIHDRLLITSIHYSILVFNLLPIYPLDGGKLLNILLNYKFSFKFSLRGVILFSYFMVFLLFFYFLKKEFTLNIFLMLSFLIYKIREEDGKRNYYYEKFLLERYLYHYNFKKRQKISSLNHLYRDRIHVIKGKDRYYTEKEALHKKFSRKY